MKKNSFFDFFYFQGKNPIIFQEFYFRIFNEKKFINLKNNNCIN